jgi:hypothetical protein
LHPTGQTFTDTCCICKSNITNNNVVFGCTDEECLCGQAIVQEAAEEDKVFAPKAEEREFEEIIDRECDEVSDDDEDARVEDTPNLIIATPSEAEDVQWNVTFVAPTPRRRAWASTPPPERVLVDPKKKSDEEYKRFVSKSNAKRGPKPNPKFSLVLVPDNKQEDIPLSWVPYGEVSEASDGDLEGVPDSPQTRMQMMNMMTIQCANPPQDVQSRFHQKKKMRRWTKRSLQRREGNFKTVP